MVKIVDVGRTTLSGQRICYRARAQSRSEPFSRESCLARITGLRRTFITTTFVLDEVATFLNSRGEHELAVETGDQLLTSSAVEMVDVETKLVREGWKFFVDHDDKTYSLTDCVSFVLMHQRGLSEALTFDHHFVQAGFLPVT